MTMKKINSLTVLLMITMVMVVLMLVTIQKPETADKNTGLLFPDLLAQLNKVDTVYFKSSQNEFTLIKKGEDWFVKEHWGYPADFNLVKRTLIDIAETKVLERKTSNLDQYAVLGVEGAAEGGASLQIIMAEGNGHIAGLLLGNEREISQQIGVRQFYVRKSDSEQAWLAEGYLNINRVMLGWIDSNVVDIARERIAKVNITQPNGDTATIINLGQKDAFGTPVMRDKTVFKYQQLGYDIAGTVFQLTLENVQPVNQFSRGDAEVVIAEFITFDGLKIITNTSFNDGHYYTTLRAESDTSMMADVPPDIQKLDVLKTLEGVAQEIVSINQRLGDWVYQVGGFVGTNMMRAKSDIVTSKENTIPMPPDLTGTQ